MNFQAQKLSGRPKVTEFEVGRQPLNKRIKIGSLLASQSKVINDQMTPQPHIPLLFASRTSWRITPLYAPLRSLSCPHGFGLRACSSLVPLPPWSLRSRTRTVPLPPPSSPQGISSALGPASRSGAGDNPLPPIDLGCRLSLALSCQVPRPQLLL